MKKEFALFIMLSAMIVFTSSPVAQAQLHERHEAAVAASSEVHPVPGGQKFTLPNPSDKVFAAVVKYLNSSNAYTVDSANKDSGLIATAMDIKGGWKQTGTRLLVTVISNSDTETVVRVVSTVQKRYKAAQADPWSDPKVDDKASAAFAAELQSALVAELSKAK